MKIITILAHGRTRIFCINLNDTSTRRRNRNPDKIPVRVPLYLAQTISVIVLDLTALRISRNVGDAEEFARCTPANSLNGEFATIVDLTCCVAAGICLGKDGVAVVVDYGKVTPVAVLVAAVGAGDGGEVAFAPDDAEMFGDDGGGESCEAEDDGAKSEHYEV
jgi:hypothetical protein